MCQAYKTLTLLAYVNNVSVYNLVSKLIHQ